MPYFSNIDLLCRKSAKWVIVWFDSEKQNAMRQSLVDAGVDERRMQLKPAYEFYDLHEEEAAKKQAFKINFGF